MNLAEGSKLKRLLNSPLKYLNGLFYRKFIYPIKKKGKIISCNTFFDCQMKVVLPAGMDIYLLGGKSHDSETRLAKFIFKTLKFNDVFVDIGAHFGYFSLFASKLLKKNGNVISIEASKSIFRVLEDNTAHSSNIDVYNLAISNKNDKLEFYEFPVLYSEYNTVLPSQFNDSSWIKNNKPIKIEIEGRKLDSLLKELGLIPSFIKIDVEGAEFMVVSGMLKILENGKDLVVSMEYLNYNRQNSAHMKATEFLINQGYFPHVIEREGNLKPIIFTDIPRYLRNIGLESDNIIFIKK